MSDNYLHPLSIQDHGDHLALVRQYPSCTDVLFDDLPVEARPILEFLVTSHTALQRDLDDLCQVLADAKNVVTQDNLLSTAGDDERRAAIKRHIDWWNHRARPALECQGYNLQGISYGLDGDEGARLLNIFGPPDPAKAVEWLLTLACWPTAKECHAQGEPVPDHCPRPGSTSWDICTWAELTLKEPPNG